MPRLGTVLAVPIVVAVAACISHVDADPNTVLTNPDDPTESVTTNASIVTLCGTICDALIENYGVPPDLKNACVFECANGFVRTPDACYELVACVADHSLCQSDDISPDCLARAGDCLPNWSLANGTCRHCWQPSRTVHGKQIVTFLSAGMKPVDPEPEDFSNKTIAALLPRANGAPYVFKGTGANDGTYSIKSVPGCGVFIQVDTTYTWASNADVDTSYPYPGRRNAKIATANAVYDITVDNLTPWTQEDWIEFFVPQLGNYGNSFDARTPPYDPSNPAATTGDTTLHWISSSGLDALIDPQQHDVMYFAQLSATPLSDGAFLRTVKRAAAVPDFTPVEGATTPLRVNLTDVAATMNVHLDFRRSTFEAVLGDLHPASQRGFVPNANVGSQRGAVDIWTHPGRPRVGANAELVLLDHDSAEGDIAPVDVTFGTPYDQTWGIDVNATLAWYVLLTSRTGAQYYAREFVSTTDLLAEFNGAPIVARIGPVKNFRIEGVPASTAQAGANLSLTPTLSWERPALAEADSYTIEVHALKNQPVFPGSIPQADIVATIVIPKLTADAVAPALHSFALPPGILARGTDYHFNIRATLGKEDTRAAECQLASSEYRP